MSKKDQALKLAQKWQQTDWNTESPMSADFAVSEAHDVINVLIDALQEALAQQEPVAWMLEWTFNGEERGCRLYDDERHCIFDAESDGGVCRPLYTSPQRTWVDLSEEDKHYLNEVLNLQGRFPIIDAIQAMLREHNNGN